MLFSGCGSEDAVDDAAQARKKPADTLASHDYCLLLFLPRVADELHLNPTQRVTLAVWRPDFQRQLKTATRATGKSRSGEQLLADGTSQLQDFGERVEQLLTGSQQKKLQKLRSDRRISGLKLEMSPAGQIGVSYSVEKELRQTQARFRFSDAMREIGGVEDAALVLGSSDNEVQGVAANWLLAHEEAALKQPDLVRDRLQTLLGFEDATDTGEEVDAASLADVTGEDAVVGEASASVNAVERRAFVEAFCLVARREDQSILLKLLEPSPIDWEIARPVLRALISRVPIEASRLIRMNLDDPLWREETLALFEAMDREAFATLGLISDVLHPAWREPLQEYMRAAGRQVDDAVVTEYRIDWSISQFGNGDVEAQNAALAWFAGAKPTDRFRDSRVANLLQPLLADSQAPEERLVVATAFSRWAGEEHVPVLLELLKDYQADRDAAGLATDALLRIAPIEVRNLLGPPGKGDRFRTARNNPYSSIVRERLSQPRGASEATLILLYEAPDEQVRVAICRAMGRIGGDRSEQFLAAQLKSDGLTEALSEEIERAIRRIRSR